MNKDFLSIHDLTAAEIHKVFAIASHMKEEPQAYEHSLHGKALALIFEKPSLRTRVSFDVGIRQLGGFPVSLLPQEINLGKRESVYDVAKNLERMVQGVMIRTFSHDLVVEFARAAWIPVINGLTDLHHPCQSLADYFTIQEIKKNLNGLKLCYVGDGNNVAHSLLEAGALLGVNVTIVCPQGYEPNAQIVRDAIGKAKETGAGIAVVHDPLAGVDGADILYTDVWASMGQEEEVESRKRIFQPFQVNKQLMLRAKPDAIFMHCLPAHRGEEVTDDVMDSRASVVFQQAENRLHAQKALLYLLMKEKEMHVPERSHSDRRELAHTEG
jgi:ornithine carbamoyltransferase